MPGTAAGRAGGKPKKRGNSNANGVASEARGGRGQSLSPRATADALGGVESRHLVLVIAVLVVALAYTCRELSLARGACQPPPTASRTPGAAASHGAASAVAGGGAGGAATSVTWNELKIAKPSYRNLFFSAPTAPLPDLPEQGSSNGGTMHMLWQTPTWHFNMGQSGDRSARAHT